MGLEQFQFEPLLKRIEKEHKFCLKVEQLVRQTEGKLSREVTLSLADMWRWLKGLLDDFVNVRNELQSNQKMLKRANGVISCYTQ